MSSTGEQRLLRARARLAADQRFSSLSGLIHAGTMSIADQFNGLPVKTTFTNGWDVVFSPAFLEKAKDEAVGYELLHCLMHKAFDHFRAYRALAWDGLPFLFDVDTVAEAQARFVQLRDAASMSDEEKILWEEAKQTRTLNEYILGELLDASVDCKLRPIAGPDSTPGVKLQFAVPPQGPIEKMMMAGASIVDLFHKFKNDGFPDKSSSGKAGGHEFPLDSPELDAGMQKVAEVMLSLSTSARMFGTEAGDLGLELGKLSVPKLSWKDRLRNLARTVSKSAAPTRTSWVAPHRRFVHQRLYLPSMISEGVGRVVVAVDTSGSCAGDVTKFLTEVYGLLQQVQPEGVDLLWVDSDVAGHDELLPGQYPQLLQSVHPKGGGGTDMCAIWDFIEAKKIKACAVVVLTDGYTPWPSAGRLKCPTWWVINTTVTAPVGTTIHMEDSDRFMPNY